MPVGLPDGDVKYHLFHIYSLSCTFTPYVLFPMYNILSMKQQNPQNIRTRGTDLEMTIDNALESFALRWNRKMGG